MGKVLESAGVVALFLAMLSGCFIDSEGLFFTGATVICLLIYVLCVGGNEDEEDV